MRSQQLLSWKVLSSWITRRTNNFRVNKVFKGGKVPLRDVGGRIMLSFFFFRLIYYFTHYYTISLIIILFHSYYYTISLLLSVYQACRWFSCLVFSDAFDVNELFTCERWHKFGALEFAGRAGENRLLDCRHCPRIITIKQDACIIEGMDNSMDDSRTVPASRFWESWLPIGATFCSP